jgi:hypothetical protein
MARYTLGSTADGTAATGRCPTLLNDSGCEQIQAILYAESGIAISGAGRAAFCCAGHYVGDANTVIDSTRETAQAPATKIG